MVVCLPRKNIVLGEMMRRLLRFCHWSIKYAWFRLNRHWRYSHGNLILGRHACLGADVLRLLQPENKVVNIHKGRVDYLVGCWKEKQRRARALHIIPHMQREEIIGCIFQEEMLYDWMKPERPVALFMDSGADLTDQQFVSREEGWSFLCSYSDLDHTEQFRRAFHATGLLAIEDFNEHFGNFFEKFRLRFGNIPIFYLHFPVKLDNRRKFIDRYWAIIHTVNRLAAEFQPCYSLAVDESVVDWDEKLKPDMMRKFPYHYNRETYEVFAEMVRKTGEW
jgi:hypothetical protein